jgi:hypothetical protein
MEERYAKLFKKWHLSWDAYYNYVKDKLRGKKFWLWVYLCGFEKFAQEQSDNQKGRSKLLYKDADERIRRIIGDFYKNSEYVRNL